MTRRTRRNHSPALRPRWRVAAIQGGGRRWQNSPSRSSYIRTRSSRGRRPCWQAGPRFSTVGRRRRPCVEALSEALARHGRPAIMNTDQGQPVHLRRLSHGLAGRQARDEPGRHGRVARHCLCRTALADAHRRGSLPARLP